MTTLVKKVQPGASRIASELILPAAVTRTLAQVAARQWRVNLTECVVLLVGAIVGLWFAQAGADWFFNLPWIVRLFLLLADLGVAGYLIWQYAMRPWQRRLNQSTAALRVEREVPDLRTSLISAVEFSGSSAPALAGSLELVRQLIAKVAAQIQSLDVVAKSVKTARLRRWAKWTGGLLLVVTICAILAGTKTPVLVQRILLLPVPLPTQTVVIPVTKDFTIAIGSDVALAARAKGVIPRSGHVFVVYANGEHQEIPVSVAADDAGLFSLTLRNVHQPFHYHFALNDGVGPDFAVAANAPPILGDFHCTQTYPKYTRLGAVPMEAGNLAFLAGSEIRLQGKSTQPLKSAVIRLEGLNRNEPMKIAADGQSVSGTFRVSKEALSGFSVQLVNQSGVTSQEDISYRVQLIPDQPPTVDLTSPAGEEMTIVLGVNPQLVFLAHDDFAVKSLKLKYEITAPPQPGHEDTATTAGEVPIPRPAPAKGSQPQTFSWNLTSLKPAPAFGTRIRYWIEATDFNDVTGPGVGESQKKSLLLVSEADKNAELLEKLGSIATDLQGVYDRQQKANQTLDTTIRQKQP